MSRQEAYIGTPGGTVLCVDEAQGGGLFRGRIYHGYRRDGQEVNSFGALVRALSGLFDELQYPRTSERERGFFVRKEKRTGGQAPGKERVMSDKELLTKHGDIGTFIIRVQQRQNSTWQGSVTWVDEDRTANFQTALELIKLLESGIEAGLPEEDRTKDPSWQDLLNK